MENQKEERPLTEEEKQQFDQVDKKLDKVMERDRSKIQLNKKTFMKISDVDNEDAIWFKEFCDKHTNKKQFLGIKVIKTVMERMDPFLTNILDQINQINNRLDSIETMIQEPQLEEQKIQLPKTQGSKKRP